MNTTRGNAVQMGYCCDECDDGTPAEYLYRIGKPHLVMDDDEPMADWERELLDPSLPDSLEMGEGHITFVTHDNREVTLRNMRYDTASPLQEDGNQRRNVVAVERFDDGRIFNVPNVAFWSVDFD